MVGDDIFAQASSSPFSFLFFRTLRSNPTAVVITSHTRPMFLLLFRFPPLKGGFAGLLYPLPSSSSSSPPFFVFLDVVVVLSLYPSPWFWKLWKDTMGFLLLRKGGIRNLYLPFLLCRSTSLLFFLAPHDIDSVLLLATHASSLLMMN